VGGGNVRRSLFLDTHLTKEVSNWSYMTIWILVLGERKGKREGKREGGREGRER